VPLAGGDHVVVAVGTDLDGAVEFFRRDGGDDGEQIALRLLAPESAAHAPHDDVDRIGGDAERVADHMLDFARMLGGGMDGDVLVFPREGECNLAFEVEMVLPAHGHRAGDTVFGGGEAGGYVAA